MKIAIVSLDNSEQILSGGKHIHQQLLKKGLENLHHEVVNFFPRRSVWYLFARVFMAILKKLKLSDKSKAYQFTLRYFEKSLVLQLKGKKIDAIFAQDPVSAVAARKALPTTKLLMTLHGYLSLESVNYGYYNESEKSLVLSTARFYEKESLTSADTVIAVDSKISAYLKTEFGYQKPITVLKNAVNPEQFNKLTVEDKGILKSKLGVQDGRKIILVPRRLVRKNGVQVAIKALKELLKKEFDRAFLVIMGEGPELNALLDLKKELHISDNYIRFLGNVDHAQAVKYYDLADIVLVPSVISDGVEEATSLSMLEGMAAKKIVIVSAIGGMKEVIVHNQNGFSFQQNDHQELAQLILDVLSYEPDRLHKIIDRGFEDVCACHHFQKHAEKYLEVAVGRDV